MILSWDLYLISPEHSIGSQDKKLQATLAYRPQANGTADRMVQTLTRSIKMHVMDENQKD